MLKMLSSVDSHLVRSSLSWLASGASDSFFCSVVPDLFSVPYCGLILLTG